MNKRSNGEGTIYYDKSKKRYVGQIFVGRDSNGKPIRKTVYAVKKKDVIKKLADIQTKIFKGIYYEPSKITLEQWLDSWVEMYKERRWRVQTKTLYKNLIRTIIIPFMGQQKISEIEPMHIQKLINKMQDDGYSYSTMEKVKNILRPSFETAIANNLISKNPFKKIQFPEKCKLYN